MVPVLGLPLEANPPLIVNADAVLSFDSLRALQNDCRAMPQDPQAAWPHHAVKLQARGPFKSENALTRFPAARCLVLLSRYPIFTQRQKHHYAFRQS
jgi:hypothetical protein